MSFEDTPPPSDTQLYFGATRYVASPIIAIPYKDKLLIGEWRGNDRELVAVIPIAEAGDWLTEYYINTMAVYLERAARERRDRVAFRLNLSRNTPDEISNISLENIKL